MQYKSVCIEKTSIDFWSNWTCHTFMSAANLVASVMQNMQKKEDLTELNTVNTVSKINFDLAF